MGGAVILAELTSEEAARARDLIALLPLGSVEQHAAHLPTGTDALLAAAVAREVEAARPESVLLLPPVWYGASDHHAGFAGTVSVGSELLARTVAAVVGSLAATTGVSRALLLNGHGGNVPAMRVALELIARARPSVTALGLSYWDALFDGLAGAGEPWGEPMGHADRVETSLMLARRDGPRPTRPGSPGMQTDDLPPWVFTTRGFADRTAGGGVGDPAGASAEEGEHLRQVAVARIVDLLDRYRWRDGA